MRWPSALMLPLLVTALAWTGCDLFMAELSKAAAIDAGDPDSGADAGDDWCPGYTGVDLCCMVDDPCGWAADDFCDCDGFCEWDEPDCGGDTDTDSDSDSDSDADGGQDAAPDGGVWCVGYTGDDTCCLIDDPCAWAGDGVCDCDATCDWDWEDC